MLVFRVDGGELKRMVEKYSLVAKAVLEKETYEPPISLNTTPGTSYGFGLASNTLPQVKVEMSITPMPLNSQSQLPE